jgi:hypothetical protein
MAVKPLRAVEGVRGGQIAECGRSGNGQVASAGTSGSVVDLSQVIRSY